MKQTILVLLLVTNVFSAHSQWNPLNALLCTEYPPSIGAMASGDFGFGAPEELYRGRLKKDHMLYGNPYTLIDRHRFKEPNEAFKSIRQFLIENQDLPIGKLYQSIYATAIGARPGNGGNWDRGASELAVWAKYNAFIFVIGLNADFKFIDTVSGHNARNDFRDRALSAFKYMDYRVPNAPLDGVFEAIDLLQFRGRELIMYSEAYDWLKGAAFDQSLTEDRWPLKKYDEDRNDGDCSPRNRLRKLARNFYVASNGYIFGPIENAAGLKRNHGIMAASAIGIAAIVLNDAGVETNYIRGLEDGILAAPNYSPVKWGKLGEKCWENLLEGWHISPFRNTPQTNADGSAGYAEGPHYFNYAMACLLPYVRTYDNWGGLDEDKKKVIKGMLTWQQKISRANGDMPTYDDSYFGENSSAGLFGPDAIEFISYNMEAGLGVDYIALMANTTKLPNANGVSLLNNSGNAMIRQSAPNGNHYFHMLYESGIAVDHLEYSFYTGETSHEHEDFGSFMIGVDNEWLAIDPPYMGYKSGYLIDEYKDHNIAAIRTPYGDSHLSCGGSVTQTSNTGFTLNMVQALIDNNSTTGMIRREVNLRNPNGYPYYIINDKFSGTGFDLRGFKIYINGNGNKDSLDIDTSSIQTDLPNNNNSVSGGRVFKWKHPCDKGRKWGLLTHTSILKINGDTPLVKLINNAGFHQTNTDNFITMDRRQMPGGDADYGYHARAVIQQDTTVPTIFQTVYYPYRCDLDELPEIKRVEDSIKVNTLIVFKSAIVTKPHYLAKGSLPDSTSVIDTMYDFHLARLDSGANVIADPFQRGDSLDTLRCNAENIYLSMHTKTIQANGFCTPSSIKVQSVSMKRGTILNFQDTNYIEADRLMDNIEYSYKSKFRYEGYSSGAGTVVFYLPDMQYGFPMKAHGNSVSSYYHNDTGNYKFISVNFSTSGTFIIDLKNPCSDDCYFPPTAMTIDSVFNFNIGSLKTLSHDLAIIPGDGVLNITNMSRMSICPDNVFVNKDSIVMKMDCAPNRIWKIETTETGTTKLELPPDTLSYICDRKLLLADRAVNEFRNTIIVNERAGLVLDSGSVTHIGNNSTILIRTGGTLLIKKGATVIIGDSDCIQNRGELLADSGSYVCVEEGAHLMFYNDIDSFNFFFKDTADRHMVYISMPDSNGNGGAILGVNSLGGRGKFDPTRDDGIWSHSTCVPFCDWKLRNAPYGVDNRPFGWCNISQPRAYFTSADTLCVNQPFSIDGKKSLNETKYHIGVCKYDTTSQTCTSTIVNINENGDYCLATRYLFTPTETGYYQVRLIVFNDCNQSDTFTKIVYVPNLPLASFTAPDSICPGLGSLYANGSLSRSNIISCKHRWTIEPIIDDSTNVAALVGLEGNKDWLIDTLATVDSNFNFPNYVFTGGMRYLVSLTVWGWCTDSTVWDTICVPLKVKINMEAAPRFYSNPVGPSAVMLKGIVLNATSWSWSPTTYLSEPDSLNTVAMPNDSIMYILTGNLNGCSASDSVFIRHNTRAYAGEDRSVCFNQKTVLGTNYNAAAILGSMYYKNGGIPYVWSDTYNSIRDGDILVQKYLTQFIIENSFIGIPYYFRSFWYDHPATRTAILSNKNFPAYFENFLSTNGDVDALSHFSDVAKENEELHDSIDALPFENGTFDFSGVTYSMESIVFGNFESWYSTKVSNSSFTDIIWEKKVDTSWVELTDWRGQYNALVDTNKTTTYRMTLIDNDNSIVEYDEVTVTIDTAVTPYFIIGYQMDSTIYFVNTSINNPLITFEWNFGDGSSHTTQKNPHHTFPAFDSSYSVCLTEYNMCGAYIHCDTVRVDSLGLIQYGFGKRGSEYNEPAVDTSSLISNKQVSSNQPTTELVRNEVALENIPNPFTESTTISYAIGNPFTKAELRVTDVLGRLIKVYPITIAKGKLDFDGSSQTRGMYYSTLVIDGVVVKSKTMLIER